jgi:hypothetical protein
MIARHEPPAQIKIMAVTSDAAVRGTIILATLGWATGEALMRRSPRFDWWARASWTAGLAMALVHVGLAFHFVYGWNHEAAVAATARQAAAQVGWGWRGGIYVNYLFLVLWFADVFWWWAAPASHASRSLRFEAARLAGFLFMFVNAAIVFASGPGRWVGIASVAAVLFASSARRRRAIPA